LLLRRVGRIAGSGSIADGQAQVTAMLTRAGIDRWRYDFADGSGMSTYNRVSPRGVARFLRWTQAQPWGAAWRSTLPVAGSTGTLRRRFVGTPLAGRLWAKTGTLNAAAGLSGFMTARSGRTLTFASFANDMPADAAVSAAVDAALLLVASER
jgi:D-alanyl-D-alanine carboxypeptidase/D-alanyl-D-alanine-endopeptidase (penicillin-binding protein 4)